MPKKRSAQLDREIANALTHPSGSRLVDARSRLVTPKRARATTKGRGSQARKRVSSRDHAADAWDVAMDALLEDDAIRAARVVEAVRAEYGTATPPTKGFSRTVRQIPESTRRDFFEHLDEVDLKDAPLQESLFKKTEWLRDAMRRLPVGTSVRVVRSDLEEYVGLKGTVTGYDLGDDGAWPGVRAKIGAATDTFYANGNDDDEIVRAK